MQTSLEHANELETAKRLIATVKGQLVQRGELNANGRLALQRAISILASIESSVWATEPLLRCSAAG
jgi:hypothetical protein